MKTDDLVNLLATGLTPVPRHPTAPRLAPAPAGGLRGGRAVRPPGSRRAGAASGARAPDRTDPIRR